MPRTWIERTLDCDPFERAAAWSSIPGTLFVHDPSAESALLFAPRWIVQLDAGGSLHRVGAMPPQLPLDGRPENWPARWMRAVRAARASHPIYCGVAGALSYELGTLPFRAAAERPPRVGAPQLWLGLYDRALVFSRDATPRLVVADLSPLFPEPASLDALFDEAATQLLSPTNDVARANPAGEPAIESLDPRWHRHAFERVQRYLRAGDVYQINLTGQILAHSGADPFAVFRHECEVNPVPHAAFLQTGELAIASQSPELLLALDGMRALSSPIKGTADGHEGALLHASVKDRAEHVMIVDLVRNDLGRSARVGEVRVRSLMRALKLRGLEHLVSDVEARLARGGRERVLGDLFPGGSITGAPKRRAIEIIAELERHRRGIYTGSVGFHDRAARARWNIAIRTAVWQNGRVAFGCGGGIVLDSDPEREYAEAMLKARSFLDSLRAVQTREQALRCSSI